MNNILYIFAIFLGPVLILGGLFFLTRNLSRRLQLCIWLPLIIGLIIWAGCQSDRCPSCFVRRGVSLYYIFVIGLYVFHRWWYVQRIARLPRAERDKRLAILPAKRHNAILIELHRIDPPAYEEWLQAEIAHQRHP